jgi:ribosome biogenesis GTPase A
MAKARRQIEEKLGVIDIVFELLDARIPLSSGNPMMQDIIGNKPRIVLLNKADLADPLITDQWVDYFLNKGVLALKIDSLKDNLQDLIYRKSKEILEEKIKKGIDKGLSNRPIKGMVLGIPNVGKSQFINNLAKKVKVKVGNKPGVTKMQSFINVGENLRVFDNPGVLWPKFEDKDVGFRLALLGSIKDSLLPIDEICLYGLDYLKKYYPEKLENRYGINLKEHDDNISLIEAIGFKRGCLMAKGEIDYDRVFTLFLHDIRNKGLGRISLERVDIDV